MTYATVADRDAIEQEMAWEDRDVPVTSYGMLSRTAAAYGNRSALSYQLTSGPTDPNETLTWSELKDQVTQAANLFRSLGVGENDVVAYIMPNATETVVAYIGGQTAGIVNPINPLLEPEQIAAILRETGAKVVVTLRAFPKTDVPQKAAEAVRLAPNVKHVLEVDLHRYLTGVKRLIVPLIRPKNPVSHGAKVQNFNQAVAAQPKTLTFDDSTEDRVAAYFHTGGTTGMPKVAQHLFSGIVYNGWVVNQVLLKSDSVAMCPLPMFHVFAATVVVGGALSSGAHVVLPTPQGYRGEGVFDNFWKLCERYKVTFVIGVPTAFAALMQRPVDADISALKQAFSGSAPLPVELYKRFEKAAGINICEAYGLTEVTCGVSSNPPDGEKKIGSVGLPLPHTEVKIISLDTHEEVPVGEAGEICISSPGVYMGQTYTEEAKNNELFYPGPKSNAQFLRTGDLGRVDEDGYLWISGRAKDLIIRGGHNIDPAEIEEALAGHEAVSFAGAIGQPDAFAGELPCVYVELVEGAVVTEEALMAYAAEHIHERAAIPKHLEVMDELPKTAVGKVFKPDLRKMAITRIYNEALDKAGHPARVIEVREDKKRGLVAYLDQNGADEEAVTHVLGEFTRPWEWREAA